MAILPSSANASSRSLDQETGTLEITCNAIKAYVSKLLADSLSKLLSTLTVAAVFDLFDTMGEINHTIKRTCIKYV